MLYPNDPLLLLFYGRAWRWGKEKMIAVPEEFFIDVERRNLGANTKWYLHFQRVCDKLLVMFGSTNYIVMAKAMEARSQSILPI